MREIKAFLCYYDEDLEKAKELNKALVAEKIDVWFKEEQLLPGEDREQKIEQAIDDSDFFILLLSTAAIKAKDNFINKERKIALNKQDNYPSAGVYIIPALIDDCKPGDLNIKKMESVDLFTDFSKGVKKLANGMRKSFISKEKDTIYISYPDTQFDTAAKIKKLLATLKVPFDLAMRDRDSKIDEKIKQKINDAKQIFIVMPTDSAKNVDPEDWGIIKTLKKTNIQVIKLDKNPSPEWLKDKQIMDFNIGDEQKLQTLMGIGFSAVSYNNSGGEKKAISQLTQIASEQFNQIIADSLAKELYKGDKKFTEQTTSLDYSQLDPEACYAAGLYEFYQGEYLTALQRIFWAVSKGFQAKDLYRKIGVCYIKLDEIENAIKALLKAKETIEPKGNDNELAIIHYNLGIAYDKKYKNLPEEKKRQLNRSYLEAPHSPNNATTTASPSLINKVLDSYKQAFKYNPSHIKAHNNRANFLNLIGQTEKGIEGLEKVPPHPFTNNQDQLTNYNLACMYAKMQNDNKTFLKLKTAINKTPKYTTYAVKQEDFKFYRHGERGKQFWAILFEEYNKSSQTNLPVQEYHKQRVSKNIEEAEHYYGIAKLMTLANNFDDAYFALKVACLLAPSFKSKIIDDPSFDNLKKDGTKFWEVLTVNP